ncbi:MAG: DUF4097 family beta strand repeat-containing protein [Prevotellaceae bacterium]|jgi:hypothetical protein|nr:DUF4097 family beta strand repeat-containing protein [Prevotellaceae bacterium]
MKRLTVFLTAVLVSLSAFAANYEASETQNYNFQLGANPALGIDNIYGNIIVSEWAKSEMQIVVERKTVSRNSQAEANEMMSCIKVDVKSEGAKVTGVTTVDCKKATGSGSSYVITYTVFAPRRTAYELAQKYGNIDMKGSIAGTLKAEVKYGNLTAEDLETNAKAEVKYGSIEIARVPTLDLDLKYGIAMLPFVESLKVHSGYSKVDLGSVNTLKGEGKYDGYKIARVGEMSMELAYTNVRMSRLERLLSFDVRYGNVSIDSVADSFSSIKINGSYTGIKIRVSPAQNFAYHIQADYANIDIPSPWNAAASTVKEGKTKQVQGVLGNGVGKLEITSRYGNVKVK